MTDSNDKRTEETLVGVISDTHGLLRPEAVAALQGSDLILHAGDIGGPEILQGLQAIAPTIAVRGNNDKGPWAATIPEWEMVEVGDILIHMLHIGSELSLNPKAAGVHVVITGHSHKPLIQEHEGVLFVNPGSAGPRRFKLPVAVAQLQIQGNRIQAELLELTV